MLTSLRQSDGLKVIGELIAKDKNETYTCEYCEKPVVHNKSESNIKVGHFKHRKGESYCPNNTGESIEHVTTKLGIYNYIKANWGNNLAVIEPEKWICGKSIRPDVYIETKRGTKIAIEVQASILSVTEIKRRTERYTRENIYVLWVLLFNHDRFLEYKTKHGPTAFGTWGVVEKGFLPRDKVRLKEFEIFIFWSYFKSLIFWDLAQEQSKGFIVAQMDNYKTDSVEFHKDGTDHHYYGKTTKTTKSVERVSFDIGFDEFKPKIGREYNGNYRDYDIPERLIFTFDSRGNSKAKKS